MALSINNPITTGLHGMIGHAVVFRTLRGKTVMSNCPRAPRYQSERQRANRLRFRNASKLARRMLLDPEKKLYYATKARKLQLPNAYTAALTDCLRKPVINTVRYKTKTGNLLITAAKKDFSLASVEVTVTNHQGIAFANGVAVQKERHPHRWLVRVPISSGKQNSSSLPGDGHYRLIVTVRDRAGNTSHQVMAYNQLLGSRTLPNN